MISRLSSTNLRTITERLTYGTATVRDGIKRAHDEFDRTFVASETTSLASDANLNFHIQNPSDNDRSAYFYHGEITHGDAVNVILHTATNNYTGVSSRSPSNNVIGSDVTTNMDVATVDTFTSSDTHFEQVYLGDGTETIFNGYRVTLPPGESLLLELQNQGGNNDVGIRFAWAESEILTGN